MPETADTYTPERVRGVVSYHRTVWDQLSDDCGLANAIYLTRFWEWWYAWGARRYGKNWRFRAQGTETEDNRLQKEVGTYNSALYPRASRTLVSKDPQGRGDPKAKAAALNQWWTVEGRYNVVRDASEMAILWPGAGFKVGVEEGTGNPVDRVYLEAIPPWELILDRDCTSIRSERYRGHLYQAPVDEVQNRYGDALAKKGIPKLEGQSRKDYLWANTSMSGTTGATNTLDGGNAGLVGSNDGMFVTVLEFVNLVDSVDVGGATYKGRLEIWLLDQEGAAFKEPIAVTPLPFAGPDGQAQSHIFPLMYMHEPGYPLRPAAPVARLLPLQVALNRLQAAMMRDINRNTRKGLIREGALGQDQQDNLMDERDMNFALVKDDRPLTDIIHMVEHQPVAVDTIAFRNVIAEMLSRQAAPSANARGEVTNATAYEIQTVQLFTEDGLKYHAMLLMSVLAQVSACVLRALIVASVDTSDSEGGKLQPGQELAAVGTKDETGAIATDGPAVTEETAAAELPPSWREFNIEEGAETFHISRETLDGGGKITFIQGERTPVSDAAILQWLTGPGGQQYMALWKLVVAGGPDGLIAERMMQQIAERSDLPKDLHPDELKRAAAELEPRPAPQQPAPGPAPKPEPTAPEQPQATVESTLHEVMNALQQAAADPAIKSQIINAGREVDRALQAAGANDADTLRKMVLAARQALSAVEVRTPELDIARKGIADVVKALGGDEPGAEPQEAPADAVAV